ncbi:MAG: galactitol-1-phosphate 5-dehydrogenase [Bacteroidota bacterium]
MRALVLTQPNILELQEVEDPTPKDDEVLIRVESVGICGSDVYGMTGASGRRIPPLIMGHEGSGTIEQVGSAVTHWKVGQRVTFDSTVYPLDDWYTHKGQYNLSDGREVLGVSCEDYRRHGAFAEFLTVPGHILVELPENVSFDHAALVEPSAVALHGIKLSGVQADESALVVGTGIIGLFVVQLLKWVGCETIIAIDIDDNKLKMAQQLGATHTINAADKSLPESMLGLTEGRGADHAFEVVGINDTFSIALKNVRKGGTVTVLGNISKEVNFPLQYVVTRQIKVQGSCGICGEYPEVLELMSRGVLDLDTMISVTAPLDEGISLFDRLGKREAGMLKVVLKP